MQALSDQISVKFSSELGAVRFYLVRLIVYISEKVEGHRFDEAQLATVIESCDYLLAHLERCIQSPTATLKATGLPYDHKDAVKDRGYRWNGAERVWSITCPQEQLDAELNFLDTLRGYSVSGTVVIVYLLRMASSRVGRWFMFLLLLGSFQSFTIENQTFAALLALLPLGLALFMDIKRSLKGPRQFFYWFYPAPVGAAHWPIC